MTSNCILSEGLRPFHGPRLRGSDYARRHRGRQPVEEDAELAEGAGVAGGEEEVHAHLHLGAAQEHAAPHGRGRHRHDKVCNTLSQGKDVLTRQAEHNFL